MSETMDGTFKTNVHKQVRAKTCTITYLHNCALVVWYHRGEQISAQIAVVPGQEPYETRTSDRGVSQASSLRITRHPAARHCQSACGSEVFDSDAEWQ